MKPDRKPTAAPRSSESPVQPAAAARWGKDRIDRRRGKRGPTRLCVERLCERVMLSGVPYAAEPGLVARADSGGAPDDPLTFGDTAVDRSFTDAIEPSANGIPHRETREFRVDGTGRLIVDMTATDSALDSMLWLYDEHGLLVNNDDRGPGQLSSKISQRLTQGTYRLEMTASLSASSNAALGSFEVRLGWQPTAEISVATSQIEGGKEGAATADLNGDGHLDIAAVNDDNRLTVAYGIGDGSFQEEVPIATLQGGASRRIIAGNFDGVGGLELAIVFVQEKQLLLASKVANGEWNISSPIVLDGTPDAMDVADLNNDQLDDLLVPTHDNNHWLFYGHAQTPFAVSTKLQLLDDDGNIVGDGRGAILGDFDGKNGPDIAISVKEAGKVFVLLNAGVATETGLATFVQSDAVPMGPVTDRNPGTEGITVGDFNGDGWTDLASVNDKSDTVSIRLNRGLGNGRFQHTGGDFKVGIDSEILRVADFNGDNIADIVVTNEDTHNVSVLIGVRGPDGKGTGAMQPRVLYACGFRPTDLGVGDFNSDGKVDVAVKLDGGGLTFLFGLGDGTFLVPESTAVGDDPDAIVVGDFNADEFLDVAVANLLSHEVSVLLGRGDGGFAPQIRYPLKNGAYPHAIAVGDVNDDGRLDLVTANEGTDDVSVLLGLGNGQFLQHDTTFEVGDSPWALAVEDFDGDGLADIATANRKSNSITILYNATSAKLEFAHEEHSIAAGSLPERLLVNKDADGNVVALATINRLTRDFTVFAFTPGTREPGLPQSTDVLPFSEPLELPIWMTTDRALPRPNFNGAPDISPMRFMPRTVTTADMNNDGHTDAIMIDDRTHATWIMLGHGDGTFAPPIQFPVSFDPEYVVAKDLDADGNIDLVIGHDTDDLVIVYYGRGDGTFDDGIEYEASDGPERLIVEDFDGDTRLDIAIANDDDAKLEMLMQVSNRTFEKVKQPIFVPAGALLPPFQNGATSGHFSGNGFRDLAVLGRRSAGAKVHIFVGRGDGTFDFDPNQSIELAPKSGGLTPKAEFTAAADLDGDGDDDIVTAEMTANRIWILWNDHGVFTPDERTFDTESPSGTADLDIRPVVIADLNQDGYPDLATVDKLFNQITILYGAATTVADRSGAYVVAQAVHVRTGRHPGTLAATDFNEDGRLDLIVGNRGSYDLSVLLGSEIEADGFTDEVRLGRTAGPPASAVADFNRDGYADRVTAREIENDLTIELGRGVDEDADGSLDFVLASNGVHGAVVNPIVVDLNGDGRDDVVSLNYRGEILVRYREVASGDDVSLIRFAPPQLVNPKKPARDIALIRSSNAWEIAAAELMDAPTGPRDEAGRVGIYRRLANGSFERTALATAAGAANIAAGDLDGDSRDELVVFSTFTSEVNVFRRNSQGQFTKSGSAVNVGNSVADISLVNAAGGAQSGVDLVVASRASSTIFVFVGNGRGAIATTPQIAARAGDETNWPYDYDSALRAVASVHDTAAVFSERIDGDDSPDFVTINRATNSLAIVFGKNQHALSAPSSISLQGSPTSATIDDVNGDKRSDIVVLYADGNADVLLGDGKGAFQETRMIFVGQGATGVRLVKVDAGDVLDLVVSNRFGDVLTRLGNGDGTFRELHRADASLFLVVEDVDGDGVGDYIFTNEARDRIEVRTSSSTDFKQDAGDGLLAPGKAVVADLNGDDFLDFVIPNFGENAVIVYLGLAPGVFGRGTSYPAGGNPAHASQADVNSDGVPDLIVANSGSNDVVVLLGDGQGANWQLRLGPRLAAGQGPVHTVIGDATADGVVDIVVTNEREDRVFVLPGRGGGFFDDRPDSIITYNVGTQPLQSFFSGSGLATLNGGSNTLSFFANSNPVSARTFPTFGSRPVAAVMGDFDFDRRVELIVAHELDGLFAIFSADADGFTLLRSQQFAGLSHPTDLAVWNDRGRISVFGVGDGREAAVLLFSAVPDTAFDLARVSRDAVGTDFLSFDERFLPFIVGLMSGAEIGAFATLVLEGDPDGLTADDLASAGGGDTPRTSKRLSQEWFAELLPEEDDADGAATGDVAETVPLPIRDVDAEPDEPFGEVAQSRRIRDRFFEFLSSGAAGKVTAEGEQAAAEAAVENVVPVVQETNRGDPATIEEASPPSKDVNVEPARIQSKAHLPPDDSRRRQGHLLNQREQKPSVTDPDRHVLPAADAKSAHALVFMAMSPLWWTSQENPAVSRIQKRFRRPFPGRPRPAVPASKPIASQPLRHPEY